MGQPLPPRLLRARPSGDGGEGKRVARCLTKKGVRGLVQIRDDPPSPCASRLQDGAGDILVGEMDEAVARSPAARVAKWLVEKGRAPEAVSLLSVRAATGNNDKESHELLAEALRIDPASPLAKLAFERMEGIQAGDHEPLEQAIRLWTNEEVARLEREIARPAFRRAQVGFNNNVKYKGLVFHIQTEDSGLDKPHIITHLFADGGRVIKSHKRSYATSRGNSRRRGSSTHRVPRWISPNRQGTGTRSSATSTACRDVA